MIPQAEALYRLQGLDLQLIQHRKRLQEIAAALQDRAVIEAAQTEVDSAQQTLAPLNTQLRDLELEIQSNTQKTQNSEDRLYSGAVKNPKELQDIQNEVASLKRRKGVLEDRLLEIMIEIEEVDAHLGACESELQQVTAEWEQLHSDLLEEKVTLDSEVEILQQQRASAIEDVTPENRQFYDTMRKQKGNQPVATIQGNACSICGIGLTTAIIQEVRHSQTLVQCQSCERILVAV